MTPSDDRLLRLSAILFAVAVLLHNLDHLRRGGDSVASDVFVLGSLGILLEVGVVALVLMGHRLGPLAAVSIGSSLAAGYLLVHLSPERSWLSDSLTAGDGVTWFSWAAVLGLVAASAFLTLAGWLTVNRRGGLASATRSGHPTGPLLHPITTAMMLGNAVIFAGSAATL